MSSVEHLSTACTAGLLSLLLGGTVAGQAPLSGTADHTIRIGLFEPDEPWADRIQAGALEALSEWNQGHAVEGPCFELVRLPRTARWRDAGAQLARFVVEHDLRAVIGPSDSASAHVASQVATRLRVPIITLSSDATLTAAKDPWIFSAVPSDLEQARALLSHALPRPNGASALLVTPRERAGRVRLEALRRACAELGVEAGEMYHEQDVVLLWLDAAAARELLEGSHSGFDGAQVLGSLRLSRQQFLESAARGAWSLTLPRLGDGRQNLGEALGRDTFQLIAQAAKSVGPSRDSIRKGLARVRLPSQRSGLEGFDARGNRVGRVQCREVQLPPEPCNTNDATARRTP